ncbi:MAG: hypothetical protein ACD_67C00043G0001 [uncultured bacterium]|nr:MAG: hypothetical protein ACD_67C00043G0001 [uncultured bacterium]
MLPRKELVEMLAPHYKAFLKTRTSESAAWTATLSQFDDLKFLLQPQEDIEKKRLLSEVKHFIKIKEESQEKEKSTKSSESQIAENKKTELSKLRGSQGIERSLPHEEENIEPRRIIHYEKHGDTITKIEDSKHEPDKHSESFLDNNSEISYISKTVLREELKKKHSEDVEKRTGLTEEARKKAATESGFKMR